MDAAQAYFLMAAERELGRTQRDRSAERRTELAQAVLGPLRRLLRRGHPRRVDLPTAPSIR